MFDGFHFEHRAMSLVGTKRTSSEVSVLDANGRKADVAGTTRLGGDRLRTDIEEFRGTVDSQPPQDQVRPLVQFSKKTDRVKRPRGRVVRQAACNYCKSQVEGIAFCSCIDSILDNFPAVLCRRTTHNSEL
jgi:hypothetical protein